MSQIVLLKRQNFIFWQSWRQGVLHPGTSRAGFFWGLIPWLADGYLHAGPSHGLFSGHAHSRCLFFFLLWIFVVVVHCQIMSNSLQSIDYSMPGFPLLHRLPEFARVHVCWVSDAIQLSHPLLPSSAFNLFQHQGFFQWVSCSHQGAKVLEFQLQHQSFQWVFRVDFL